MQRNASDTSSREAHKCPILLTIRCQPATTRPTNDGGAKCDRQHTHNHNGQTGQTTQRDMLSAEATEPAQPSCKILSFDEIVGNDNLSGCRNLTSDENWTNDFLNGKVVLLVHGSD